MYDPNFNANIDHSRNLQFISRIRTKYFNRAKKTKYLKIKMIEMKSMSLKTFKSPTKNMQI